MGSNFFSYWETAYDYTLPLNGSQWNSPMNLPFRRRHVSALQIQSSQIATDTVNGNQSTFQSARSWSPSYHHGSCESQERPVLPCQTDHVKLEDPADSDVSSSVPPYLTYDPHCGPYFCPSLSSLFILYFLWITLVAVMHIPRPGTLLFVRLALFCTNSRSTFRNGLALQHWTIFCSCLAFRHSFMLLEASETSRVSSLCMSNRCCVWNSSPDERKVDRQMTDDSFVGHGISGHKRNGCI